MIPSGPVSAPEPKKKRFVARPLLVAGAGLSVISMGATQAFASGNLMAYTPCPAGEARVGANCVPLKLPDAGTALDAGVAPTPAKKPK